MNILGHKFTSLEYYNLGFDDESDVEAPQEYLVQQMTPFVALGRGEFTKEWASGTFEVRSEMLFGCGSFSLLYDRIPVCTTWVVWNERRSAEYWTIARGEYRKLPGPVAPPRCRPPAPWAAQLYAQRFGEVPVDLVIPIADLAVEIVFAMMRVAQGVRN